MVIDNGYPVTGLELVNNQGLISLVGGGGQYIVRCKIRPVIAAVNEASAPQSGHELASFHIKVWPTVLTDVNNWQLFFIFQE